MTTKPDSTQSQETSSDREEVNGGTTNEGNGNNTIKESSGKGERHLATLPRNQIVPRARTIYLREPDNSNFWLILCAIAVLFLGLYFNNFWVGLAGAIVTFLISLRTISPSLRAWLINTLTPQARTKFIGFVGLFVAIAALLNYIGFYRGIKGWLDSIKWDEFGSWADWVGAIGQIMIAVLAVYVAWRQYVISKDLTIQQNRITQQQTIDAYFQGISELALNDEGLLEDWPQERAIAEGRTAAIFASVDGEGKAKILRFLSQSRLVTPLRRDNHLGRPILDGSGNYAEDRAFGVRVIDLGVMLAGVDLSGQDLRWTDLSEANLVRANLSRCDLVKANLSRTVLYEANLAGTDIKSTRFYYGDVKNASPRSRTTPPDYETGAYTGAVVEKVDFTRVQRMNDEQRYYCCCWCGEKSRATIPGGCDGIPNKLGR
ncbi:pentapeptide repeat-containing protein [Oscillatoria salina]|uniref:pentapeptide repeat-containing protein n=1 Tax=Oscillatoria salina TaxID=331517 RepID=UPI0013BA4F7B|nr:pentapeptide repeat-containing protein [Oscillatoria salina]MBZ8180492.1 pentapeptide repeat-containing protein [Oscillatoria salina IIICB1]NET87973.1 pentapeptide repeat-containing protein [Kamptonema sp. SIO1D9]